MRGTSETPLLHTKSVVAASQPYVTQPPRGKEVRVRPSLYLIVFQCLGMSAAGLLAALGIWLSGGPEMRYGAYVGLAVAAAFGILGAWYYHGLRNEFPPKGRPDADHTR